MIYLISCIIILAILIFMYSNNFAKSKIADPIEPNQSELLDAEAQIANIFEGLSYKESLNKVKEFYPFTKWRTYLEEYEMEQYTEENCFAAEKIVNDLLEELLEKGENASEKEKLLAFENAIKELNSLSAKVEGLIETGEREDLCDLIDTITVASGMNPGNYSNGEGIADLWRKW